MSKRFAVPAVKNVMAGVLLTPGPVSTHTAFKSLSRVFNMAINKAKYLSAARKLQDAGLGMLVVLENISSQSHVFVKKMPSEAQAILERDRSAYLCTPAEYEQRFYLPPMKSVTPRIQQSLIQMGYVAEGLFVPQKESKPKIPAESAETAPS